MNIKDTFVKWKRVLYKRRELISRIVSICLIVLLIAVVAVAAINIRKADIRREEIANQDQNSDTIKVDRTKFDAKDPAVLERDFARDFKQVAANSNLVLFANEKTGEIAVGKKGEEDVSKYWYSNPAPETVEADELATVKDEVRSQIVVDLVNLDKCITVDYNSFGGSTKKGRMECELIENGVKFTYGFPTANVFIPVQYTLLEDGFQAEVVVDEIVGVGKNPFMVEKVDLLPYFGAGNLEDEGYLFVPDGSGALINYNNNKHASQYYAGNVYGVNPTLTVEKQGSVIQNVTMPVFGAKRNDQAFFGIITSGEGSSEISAIPSRKDSSYNHVYSTAVLREYDLNQVLHDGVFQPGNSIDYSQQLITGNNYAVRYFFLEGEDANYSGMSRLYRDYLEKNGKLNDSALADEKYMVIDLIGAVSIKKYVMGVKRPVVTAMTTYNEVCQIVEDLKAQGVENLAINYIGALNSGLNNKMYNKVSTESALGTKKEFKAMVDYLQQEGVLLFMESNPVDLYENGNGYKENRESAKTFFDKYAFQYKYDLDTGDFVTSSRWHLLRPRMVKSLVSDFVDSAAKWNIKQISLAKLGDTVYSDYIADENYISRPDVLKVWDETLKETSEKMDYLMLHGGNAYSLPYADVITDVSDCDSNYDVENHSVPFYQMTFQDSVLLTGNGINTTVDYEYAFLKALETGCSLKYNFIYGDVSQLVGTDYNTMVAYSYEYWKNLAVEEYKAMQETVGQFAGKQIIGHEILADNVTVTTYDNAKVVVNYGETAYTYGDAEIGARDYLVIQGGVK